MRWLLEKAGLIFFIIVLFFFSWLFASLGGNPFAAIGACFRRLIGRPNWEERQAEAEMANYKSWLGVADGDKILLQEAIRMVRIRHDYRDVPAEELQTVIEELKAQNPRR